MKQFVAVLAAVLTLALPLAAQVNDHANLEKGAVLGGVLGAVVGGVVDHNRAHKGTKHGLLVGGLAGGAAGAIVGAMMDRQERELRSIQGVNVTRTADDELKVTVKNDVLFDFNSAQLRPASRSALNEMSDVFKRYGNTTIDVRGYTDSIGSANYNERLSERRAGAVANYIERLGVNDGRVQAEGLGKSNPRASNATASGRQLNRRVEIFIHAQQS